MTIMENQTAPFVIDTFNIIQLRNVLKKRTAELIENKIVTIEFGSSSGLPVAFIKECAETADYIATTKSYQSPEASAKIQLLAERLTVTGFFAPTKDNKNGAIKPLFKSGDIQLMVVANILYNFDSFNYFSSDPRVFKTIFGNGVTEEDQMYVLGKVQSMIEKIINEYKFIDFSIYRSLLN